MNLKVRYNLWKEQRRMSPNFKFKRALLARVLDSRLRGNDSEDWRGKHPIRFFAYFTHLRWGVVMASVLLLALLATGAYAYNSDEVTEGTVLYPVKQKLEEVEELTKRTPEAKADFYLKQIKRREAEEAALERRRARIEKAKNRLDMLEKNIEASEEKAERVQTQLEEVNKILSGKNSAQNKELRQRVQAILEAKKIKRERELDKKVEMIRRKAEMIDKLYASLEEEMEKEE
ncbi:hypothetical protein EPN28_04480 [Patescibacteria group bacterium]|nr:MAG: hypothetical protein EPN28_04480 [Patescibacteria group bacterium]